MFSELIVNVSCIFLMMLPGYIAVRRGLFSRTTVSEMSNVLVMFFYPSLIFHSLIESFTFGELLASWTLPASCFTLMLLGFGVGLLSAHFISFRNDDDRTGFLFQSTMNNYSFLPLPLVYALFGEKGAAALIFSSFGAEIALWTLGVFIIQGRKVSPRNLLHLFSVPLCILYLAVLILFAFQLTGTDGIGFIAGNRILKYTFNAIGTIGGATVPVAMLVGGARIATIDFGGLREKRVWILSFVRLVLVPSLAFILLALIPIPADTVKIIAVVAVMPVALASIILSEMHGRENSFIAMTVLSTHLLAPLSVPLMLYIASLALKIPMN